MKVHLVISPYPREGIVSVLCSPKDSENVLKLCSDNGITVLVAPEMKLEADE